jgi:hypothetical protein
VLRPVPGAERWVSNHEMQVQNLLVPSNLKINRAFAFKVRSRYEPVGHPGQRQFTRCFEDITRTHTGFIHGPAWHYRRDLHRWPGMCQACISGSPRLLSSVEEEGERKNDRY